MAEPTTYAVFGGTGFLGRRVVRHLAAHNQAIRVISRHPERGQSIFAHQHQLSFVQADIEKDSSIRTAMRDASGVVNAVSLYVERGRRTFNSVHVKAAATLARISRDCGVARLIHVSGVGADARSESPYIQSRGKGEVAVRSEFPNATIVRPTVMFGVDDAFLNPLVSLLRRSPVFPIFGYGRTALQPVWVEDVGEAIARALDPQTDFRELYEFGGPRSYSYRELLQVIGEHLGRSAALIPVPYEIWRLFALLSETLPRPVITRNQIELMAIDNITGLNMPGFECLGIVPQGIELVLPKIIAARNSAGAH